MGGLKKISKIDLLKLQVGVERNRQVEDGFFDGRFVQRVSEKDKKKYTRYPKYRGKDYNQFNEVE
jgi:hypothetical protein